MPDFTIAVTAGVTFQIWTDPPTVDSPSRQNPLPGRPHTYPQALVGSPVTLTATVAGVAGPLDGALGGRLFTWSFAEWPTAGLVAISSPGGQTSVASFTPTKQGHHMVVAGRTGGGAVMIPIIAVVI